MVTTMIRLTLLTAGLLALAPLCSPANAFEPAPPRYERLKKHRAAGEDPNYHVNRYGYGNYVRGPDGSYGGYPAGSAGARELEINTELKCRYTPESC